MLTLTDWPGCKPIMGVFETNSLIRAFSMFVHRHQSPNGQIKSAATIGGSKQERAAVICGRGKCDRNVLVSSSLDIIGIYNKQKMPKKSLEMK